MPADAEPTTAPPTPIIWAIWALFVGLGLMLTGAGLFSTVVGIRAELDGFPTVTIGAMSGGYYLGFLTGSRLTLRALGSVGHIRVYAALASLLAATMLLAGMVVHPVPWIVLRLISGACVAGQYVVAESWLNQLVDNANRARLIGTYSLATIVAIGVGQVITGWFDPTTLTVFGVGAMLISLAVAPVSLSADAAPPPTAPVTHMSLRELLALAPTGTVTSSLVGVAHGAFLGFGAVYATRSGLSLVETGWFVAMPTLGSLLLQIPIASASDTTDRRLVGSIAATVAAGAATVLLVAGPTHWLGFAAMVLIGGTTYPLYSIAGAYTNDIVPADRLTAVASQLIVVFGAGAFVGPLIAATTMAVVGAEGFVWTTIVVHVVIAGYLVVRQLQHPAATRAVPRRDVALAGRLYLVPATVAGMGRRLRIRRPRAGRPGVRRRAGG